MNFERVLQKVLWRLVTEGSISYRRIKLSFALDDDGLEELRSELIGIKRVAADVDGKRLVLASEGRLARPEGTSLPQPYSRPGWTPKICAMSSRRIRTGAARRPRFRYLRPSISARVVRAILISSDS
jgi:hypothetical protein